MGAAEQTRRVTRYNVAEWIFKERRKEGVPGRDKTIDLIDFRTDFQRRQVSTTIVKFATDGSSARRRTEGSRLPTFLFLFGPEARTYKISTHDPF